MKTFLSVIVTLFLFFIAAQGNASTSPDAVYDEKTDLLWYADPVSVKNITEISADTPDGFNHNGWRIATISEVHTLSENCFEALINDGFSAYDGTLMLNSIYKESPAILKAAGFKSIAGLALGDKNREVIVEIIGGKIGLERGFPVDFPLTNLFDKDAYGVWAVADPISTPVPAAVWLLGFGQVGLVGLRRKSNRWGSE